MATPTSDFDAAKAVADQLKEMDRERQQRILRWVAESLGLDLTAARQGGEAGRTPETTSGAMGSGAPPRNLVDIKTFVASKMPRTDVQFATVVAYYYRFEAKPEIRKNSIDTAMLQEAARLAGRRRPPQPRATLNNAKKVGYLDSTERGQFQINSVGENLVAMTLPGKSKSESHRISSRKTKPRSTKPRSRRQGKK